MEILLTKAITENKERLEVYSKIDKLRTDLKGLFYDVLWNKFASYDWYLEIEDINWFKKIEKDVNLIISFIKNNSIESINNVFKWVENKDNTQENTQIILNKII